MKLRELIRPLAESSSNFTPARAKAIAKEIGLHFNGIKSSQFRKGLEVEREHERDPETRVVGTDDKVGKIAWAHLKELPDYYTRLDRMERQGKQAKRIVKRRHR